jgi:hypothetical protein
MIHTFKHSFLSTISSHKIKPRKLTTRVLNKDLQPQYEHKQNGFLCYQNQNVIASAAFGCNINNHDATATVTAAAI